MAGHVVTKYLSSLNRYEIHDVDLKKLHEKTIILNVERRNLVEDLIQKINPSVVINCIGLLIKESEKNIDRTIFLNSYFPHFLARLGKKYNFKLIHLSTDCVFSGKKGNYNEEDVHNGTDYYSKTKSLGEIINEKDLTFRTSIIGPELRKEGIGLFNWFISQKGKINGYKNVFWTGITTLELARAMDSAIEQDLCGLYHLVPSKKISKFDLLMIIKEIWKKSIEIIPEFEYEIDKSLINNRSDFNFRVKDYDQMIKDLFLWMEKRNY